MNYELLVPKVRTMNNLLLPSDKQASILTCQRTQVNKKVTQNVKNPTFVVFGHPELVEGSLPNEIRFTLHERRVCHRGRREHREEW